MAAVTISNLSPAVHGLVPLLTAQVVVSNVLGRRSTRPVGLLSIANTTYVQNAESQAPIEGIRILALDAASGELIASTTSGAGGGYSFSGLSAEPVIVVAVDLEIGRVAAVEAPIIPD